jgi:aminoglycoside/choline kinase family phosphotransferase
MKNYLETQLHSLKGIESIKKLRGEASTRNFFRVSFKNRSLVAMVYPVDSTDEIDHIEHFTRLYTAHGLKVPAIEAVIGKRIILQEDLGDLLVQTAFARFSREEKKKVLERIARMVVKLGRIPVEHTVAVLDTARMKWEMDFFLTHFVPGFCAPGVDTEQLRRKLHEMVERIYPIKTFAHRDFHSRNMLFFRGDVYLVDFQDSLAGPMFYDLVSFLFDAYLDLGTLRGYFLDLLHERNIAIDETRYFLTALQRNVKALGTFGFQVTVRKNLIYKKYMARTVRHILSNPLFGKYLNSEMFK